MAKKPTYEELEQKVKELEKEIISLKQTQDQLNAVVNKSPIPTAVGGSDGSIMTFNEALEKLIGYKKFEIKDITEWANKLYPDQEYREFVWKNIKQALEGRRQGCTEFKITCKDGSTIVIDFHTSFFQDGIIIQMVDITERKRAEEALRESEGKFSKAFFSSAALMAISTLEDGRFLEINDVFERTLEYKRDEVIGKTSGELDLFVDIKQRDTIKKMSQESGYVKDFEIATRTKSAAVRIGLFSTGIIQLAGKPHWLTVMHDITNRKRAEEALRESEDRYRSLFEQSNDAIIIHELNGQILEVNQRTSEMLGYDQEQFHRMTIPMIHPKTEFETAEKAFQETKSEGHTVFESQLKRADGILIDVEISSRVVDEENGIIQGIIRDISQRKRAGEALRESEEKFRLISEQSLMAIVIVQDDKIKYANQAYLAMTGYSWEEIMNWTMGDTAQTIYPEDRDFVMEQGRKKAAGIRDGVFTHYSYRGITKSGEVRWVDQYSKTITYRGKPADLMTFIDIHDQKLAQETLRQSEKKYRELADSLPQVVFETDEKGKLTFVNRNAFDLFGYSQHDFDRGLNTIEMLIPEDRNRAMENIQRVMSGEGSVGNEYTALRKDGSTFPISMHSNALLRENRLMGMRGIIIDLTERKKSEEKLRFFQQAVDGSTDGVGMSTPEGRHFYQNEAFAKLFGLVIEEVEGETGPPSTVYFDEAQGYEIFDTLMRGGSYTNEIKMRGKEGLLDIFLRAYSVKNPNGEVVGLVGVHTDITDKKRLEDQLHQAQKMEAIGMLAGGVAHDLNNILGGLVSYPELLLLQLPEDSPLRKSILTIQKSGAKAAAVVQDLLTLARRGVVATEVINLNNVISEYLKSPEHENLQSYHPAVHLETHLEKDVLNILGSSTHLSKTVMNLVSNAAEAMPEGGKLSVSMENRYIDRPIRGYDDVKEGDYVILTIADTGTGISPDDIEKIFEPFYTKKKMGKSGTGLGMAVVWGTVKDHNGYIDVQSTEGKGTTFTLYFPVTREKLPEDKSSLAIESYSGNGESILIVDDVEEQRKIVSGMLKELGYSVVSVSSGEEAVEYLKTNKTDLLLLDMIMDPGMDGLDTYKKILKIHPVQKAIIASGFSETGSVKEVQRLGAGAYIRKPLLLEKIGLAVKEELEK